MELTMLRKLFPLVLIVPASSLAIQAATFTVANGDIAGLRAAIIAANATPAADTISLATNGDYSFPNYYPTANPLDRTALPPITSFITIEGHGSILRRADQINLPIPQFRLIRISATGSLTMRSTSVQNGELGPVNGDEADSTGSGLRNDGGLLDLEQCRFENNRNTHWAAGIQTTGPTVVLDSDFISNISGDGGTAAIRAQNMNSLMVSGCQFTSNTGEEIIRVSSVAEAEITRSSIVKSGAGSGQADAGIGIRTDNSALKVANCTITRGPSVGLSIHGSTVSVTQCTITEHGAQIQPGSAIHVYSGSLSLRNSILALNDNGPAGFNADCLVDPTGTLVQNVNNLIGDGTCSPAFSGDPKLGPLDYYGGSTLAFPLLSGSIALDNGSDLYSETIDQRGVSRPIGAHCDIGAYEGYILDPAVFSLVNVNLIFISVPYFIVCDPLGPITMNVTVAGSRALPARAINAASLTLGNTRAGSARVIGFSDVNRDGLEDLTVEFRTADVYRGAQSCRDVSLLDLQGTTSARSQILGHVEVAPLPGR